MPSVIPAYFTVLSFLLLLLFFPPLLSLSCFFFRDSFFFSLCCCSDTSVLVSISLNSHITLSNLRLFLRGSFYSRSEGHRNSRDKINDYDVETTSRTTSSYLPSHLYIYHFFILYFSLSLFTDASTNFSFLFFFGVLSVFSIFLRSACPSSVCTFLSRVSFVFII